MRMKKLSLLLALTMTLSWVQPALAVETKAVTREYAVSALVHAAGLEQGDPQTALLSYYGDGASVDSRYQERVASALSLGIVKGTDGSLNPTGTASRLEALVLLSRCLPQAVPGSDQDLPNVPQWAKNDLAKVQAAGLGLTLLSHADLNAPITRDELTALCEELSAKIATQGSLSHPGYTLEQTVVLSRHNIRSPLSTGDSLLAKLTPHRWFSWTSASSELSLRGGALETLMGQYFRKWLESEGMFLPNEVPASEKVRFYANSMQRTIATAQYFSSGFLPIANLSIEHHMDLNTMDPVFTPQLLFTSDAYREDVKAQLVQLYGADDLTKLGHSLAEEFALLEDTLDLTASAAFQEGTHTGFRTDDLELTLDANKEPGMKGSLKTATSASDALVLQYYEETDRHAASFGDDLDWEGWENISRIKDAYGDILFTAPLVSVQTAHPLLQEIQGELNTQGRSFSFLCGHDSNLGSVLAALGAQDYSLPGAIEKKTPIGSKLVFSRWKSQDGQAFYSLDLVYQTVPQLRELTMLGLDNPPAIYSVTLSGLEKNADGLYPASALENRLQESISAYDAQVAQYSA